MKIVITGASHGIGAFLAEHLEAERLYLIYGHDEVGVEKLHIRGGCGCAIKCDVSKKADVESAFNLIGDIDVLINNAGVNIDSSILKMGEDEWDRVVDVNLKGTFLCTKYALPKMQNPSHIINISSIVSKIGAPGASNYAASKGGVEAFTRSAAKELIQKGIRVNCLSLGYFDIGLGRTLNEKTKQKALDRIGLKEFGDPMEIVRVIQYIIGSGYLVGSVIELNGGLF